MSTSITVTTTLATSPNRHAPLGKLLPSRLRDKYPIFRTLPGMDDLERRLPALCRDMCRIRNWERSCCASCPTLRSFADSGELRIQERNGSVFADFDFHQGGKLSWKLTDLPFHTPVAGSHFTLRCS